MSNSDHFNRLTELLREADLKQDKIAAKIRLTHEALLTQNETLEQIHNNLERLLTDTTSANGELSYSLAETNHLAETLAAENREKAHITSILDLLTKP